MSLTAHPAVRPGSRLSPAVLSHLAAAIVATPGRWSELVRFDPARRWYRRLELADDHEVWLLSWLPGQQTGLHDHGIAAGAFAVADGELTERTPAAGGRQLRSRVISAGQARAFGRQHVHDVGNAASRPAVSIHVYSPPLTAMRRYEMTGSGLVPTATDVAEVSW